MRPEKQLLLDEIQGLMEENPSFVIMSYAGLDANSTGALRNQIAKLGGDMEVVRKRILVKAAQAAGIELSVKTLPGHISLVFSGEDPVQTTKALFAFKKESPDAVDGPRWTY